MADAMKGFRRSAVAWTALTALLAASAGAVRVAAGREVELVRAEEVHAEPVAHLGRTLRLRLQLESELADWNPFLTRFGRADYRAFRAWSDEQFLWNADDWSAPLAGLFARRGTAVADALAKLPRYSRFEAVVTVRQVFLSRPWLEVESIAPLGDSIGEGSILHASRAMRLRDEERWSAAAEDFERALVGPMPEIARTELRRLRDEALQNATSQPDSPSR
jgi:hypothetical protein